MISVTSQRPARVSVFQGPPSPAGPVLLGISEQGALCRLGFLHGTSAAKIRAAWQKEWPQTTFVLSKEKRARLPKDLLLVGSAFQLAVWQALLTIPEGEILTYGEMAALLGKPGAARAVGNALGANPIPWRVPCHRICAAGGKIGGFSGGLDVKKLLLRAEGIAFR